MCQGYVCAFILSPRAYYLLIPFSGPLKLIDNHHY